jgi:hypothetical protein
VDRVRGRLPCFLTTDARAGVLPNTRSFPCPSH